MPEPISPESNGSEVAPHPRLRTPIDYYSAPEVEVRPLFPRGVPIGCGAISAGLLLILFIGGALVAHFGIGQLMDPLLGRMGDELSTMYTKDVTAAERKSLDGEITRLRDNVRTGKIAVAKLDPAMSALREAIRDQKITPDETAKLTRQIHELNSAPASKPHAPKK